MPGRALSILIVDDDALVRRALVRTLRHEPNLVVDHVGTAKDALERHAAAVIDLTFLDLEMPDGTGVDLAIRIRKIRPASRILFMTADPDSRLASEARALPCEGLIPKPWKSEELFRLVRAIPSA